MSDRIPLHEKLCSIIGNRNVYFQDPGNIKFNYPAIKYDLSGIETVYADNKVYKNTRRYTIVLIQDDPDTPLIDKMLSEFNKISCDRQYKENNKYHDVFTLWW